MVARSPPNMRSPETIKDWWQNIDFFGLVEVVNFVGPLFDHSCDGGFG